MLVSSGHSGYISSSIRRWLDIYADFISTVNGLCLEVVILFGACEQCSISLVEDWEVADFTLCNVRLSILVIILAMKE